MKALVLRKHGGLGDLEVVGDYPVPQATEGNVVIRVRASSFNYHDVFTVKGMPGIKVPLPVVIGLDMAGEIAEVGPGVAKWKAGDRVLVNPLNKKKGLMGEMLDGGMAEYCLVAADQLVAVPNGVSFEDAASLPVAYGTAHRMLITHKTVKSGDRVIVLGASGGVGTACVILAKLLGAEVIACASSEAKMARLKELGADEAIDYTTDFTATVRDQDVVLDVVGGDYPARALDVLKPGGMLVSTQPPSVAAVADAAAQRDIRVAGVIVEADEVGMAALADLAARGQLVPTIAATFPLEEARAASAMADLAATGQQFPLEQGGATESGRHGPGKVVLTME